MATREPMTRAAIDAHIAKGGLFAKNLRKIGVIYPLAKGWRKRLMAGEDPNVDPRKPILEQEDSEMLEVSIVALRECVRAFNAQGCQAAFSPALADAMLDAEDVLRKHDA